MQPVLQTFNLETSTSNTKTIISNSTSTKTSSRLENANTQNEEDDQNDLVPLDEDNAITQAASTNSEGENQQKQEQVVKWIYEEAEKEKRKLLKQKVNVDVIRAKNFGIVRENDRIWNRIECHTLPQQHFSTVAQVLVSSPTKCPLNQLEYVNIILLPKDMRRAFLVPYLYDPKLQENQLSHWIFIDTALQHHKFVIENMRQI